MDRTGAELIFEVFSQRYERGSIIVTTNLPFDEWTEAFGSERLTGALLDRLHPPCAHPGDERRKLPTQAQQGNRRVSSSRRSRGRIGRTVNAVSTCSFNVPTPTNLLALVIASVVHDNAAPVAQYLGAIDIVQFSSSCSDYEGLEIWPESFVQGDAFRQQGQGQDLSEPRRDEIKDGTDGTGTDGTADVGTAAGVGRQTGLGGRQGQVAHRGRELQLEPGFDAAEVASLAGSQLDQPRQPVLHHHPALPILAKGLTPL